MFSSKFKCAANVSALRKAGIFLIVPVCFHINAVWGFFGHQQINKLAVFTLPPDMIRFYKEHLNYITEAAVNPDRRRYAVPDEAPRHYIDLDHYGDSAIYYLPKYWTDAVACYSEDTLKAYGIVPWHINTMYARLRHAFLLRDPDLILKLSAEIGHYIADAHVPLHTTENYNGQLTGQVGIHGLWESRLPELFAGNYDFFVGKAEYLTDVQAAAWNAVRESNELVAEVLALEKDLTDVYRDKKFGFETRGRQTLRVYSRAFSKAYHDRMKGMVEARMRAAVKMIGDVWYTAWVEAGQPDITALIEYKPGDEELARRKVELEQWRNAPASGRPHENR
ncbi:MAG: S1/P1 Nuclease [Bacteroidia bacterium]|nr:S1/P1 Nuclease [Bacteroidia bacterium]